MATYYLTLTQHGAAALAAAQASGPLVAITHLVLGDANGQPYLPDSAIARTALVNERARLPVISVTSTADKVTVETLIPPETGGFSIHEIGLTDASGQLLYLGNWTGSYKPVLSEGGAGDMQLTIELLTSGLPTLVVQYDPKNVTASRQWALDRFVLQSTYDAHVDQNALEHADLAGSIQAEREARQQARIDAFEAANPIGTIYSGDSLYSPNTRWEPLLGYETFWRKLQGQLMNGIQTNYWKRVEDVSAVPELIINLPTGLQSTVNLLDLATNALNGAPNLDTQIVFVLADNALLYSSSTSAVAVTTGVWPTQSLPPRLKLGGIIAGHGGNGGNESTPATDGGDAFEILSAIHITQGNTTSGSIQGGGGGGAYAEFVAYDVNNEDVWPEVRPKTGGGGGVPCGLGGQQTASTGEDTSGDDATDRLPGAGGNHTQPGAYVNVHGQGGVGGRFGEDGDTPTSFTPGTRPWNGGAGQNPGQAGRALVGTPSLAIIDPSIVIHGHT